MKKNKKAFTLAEVLITLLIIGIISSIVIPALINDTQDAELNTALKKTYAELSAATKQIVYENGGTFKGVLAVNLDYLGLRNAYAKHMSYTKFCDDGRNEGCWHPLSADGGTWKGLDGGNTDTSSTRSGLILSNGTLINFLAFSRDCSYQGLYYTKPVICGWIIIDINGFKKPNITGKDIFYFNILANKLEPWGAPDSLYKACGIEHGAYCTASRLMQ